MIMQTFWMFLIAALGYCNSVFGSSLLNRPLILSSLVGLALGNLETGIKVGASLELVWLGAMAIGASNPPDMTSGSIIGCGYVLVSGADIAQAVALAVPVSILMSMVWNFLMAVPGPFLSARADAYALAKNPRGIERMHYLFVVLQVLLLASLCAAGFYVGSHAIQGVVDAVPEFVTRGLDYAMGIIPALGFAMLARAMVDKKTACFLLLGFLLVAYGNLSLMGVSLVAIAVAALLTFNVVLASSSQVVATDSQEMENNNEF
ncbi:PTS sugar transporter subunit IIC [Collinsella sp. zg1085]|uniref:PTS mannose/fructose/sorbose/N-acetylgalactosamine transporter subunit IIC n=1 Tax=Collinsella sp. zg1085 TaxID=2844380 RepID=UPI001C0E0A40|nr:PTS sugar transporter subunit IIC [Collinsella sp. zg1085]QWT17557.1 PTS sugar transporter subunit IIC [Collinsella sp. zg1085]